jgi:hypothetical protein
MGQRDDLLYLRGWQQDGMVPTTALENRFREKGIKLEYNANGYIVIRT